MPPVVEAPVVETQPQVETPATPSYEDRVGSLTGEARHHWDLTGNLDEAEKRQTPKTKNSDASAASSTATPAEKSETAPAPGTGTQEPQPKARSNRDWRKEVVDLKDQEIDRLKKENERLKSAPSAESGKPAPAAQKVETAPQDPPPEFPDIAKFANATEFNKAVAQWQKDHAAWTQKQVEQRLEREKQTQTSQQREKAWTDQLTAARTEFKDFDTVALSKDTPASFTSLARLKLRTDGAKIAYYLGKNKEEATKLAESTHVRGIDTPQRYQALLHAAKTNPELSAIVARVEALADAEFERIAAILAKPAATPQPTPKPKPTAEVAVSNRGSAVDDELADAIKRGDQASYERIQNERDRKKFGR